MPNCDFYAIPEDHAALLSWLFAEGTCEVYELYSRLEQPLRRFSSPNEVTALFEERFPNGDRARSVHLALYALGSGPPFVQRRIRLNPSSCDGATFRYRADGWGIVQLKLESVGRGELRNSHTNHFSQKGAMKWANNAQHLVESWNFKQIAAFSSRLNRQIKKRAAGKIGSRVVLPGALKCFEGGTRFLPYDTGHMTFVDTKANR